MDYEALGAFYLGRLFDSGAGQAQPAPLLYDSKDLTTHAVCLGMTGSGKTGLCIGLLEEAAIDGVPAIVIDPKGDLGNLLLTFPELAPEDFEPWVDRDEANRKGMSPAEVAAAMATRWRKGLAEWGQTPERIAKLRAAADFSIYTPGSSAGRPLTVLRSFDPPPAALLEDGDGFRERVSSTASGLLALLGIDADPLRSREHILVATLLDRAWRDGRALDIATLIKEIRQPDIDRIGVVDLEEFFPENDRAELSMSINALLASPGFGGWLEGEPLNVKNLLWTDTGKPRVSVLSIAHLSEAERMFFVTILYNEIVSWMRTQSGTSSLRAIIYMDEVYGYLPPVANPPSKAPIMTLLKQARAYGVGMVLATQNPVDLDYKGLSNTGTWFIGRLQTERDVERVIDGLEGAASSSGHSFDRQRIKSLIAGLDSRVFLLNNVHEDEPVLFQTRWVLSYLRGPMTRAEIKQLKPADAPAATSSVVPKPKASAATATNAEASGPPEIDPDIGQVFVRSKDDAPTYEPALLGTVDLHFISARDDIDVWEERTYLAPLGEEAGRDVWDDTEPHAGVLELADHAEPDATFVAPPREALKERSYKSWATALKGHTYKTTGIDLYKCKKLKLSSTLGESEADFRVRVREAAREKRDAAVDKLRDRYAKKLSRLQDQIGRAEDKVEQQQEQVDKAKMDTAVSAGTTLLGALFGRKVASVGNVSRAGSTIKRASKISKEKQDVVRAKDRVDELEARLEELEADLKADIEDAEEIGELDSYEITEKLLRPRKSDIEVKRIALAWDPR